MLNRYFLIKTFVNNGARWLFVVFIYIALSIFNVLRKSAYFNTIEECLFTSLDDRLMMLVIFSIIPLVLTSGASMVSGFDLQIITRCQSKKKWYYDNVLFIWITSFLVISIYFLIFHLTSLIHGLQHIGNWNQSIFNFKILLNPDSFDNFGQPFSYIFQNNTLPLVLIFQAMLLLTFRTVFWGSLVYNITIFSKRTWIGVICVVIISWIEIYFYNIIKINRLYIFPHEFSIVTTINGVALPIWISAAYWVILIIILHVFGYINFGRSIERAICTEVKGIDGGVRND